jgi:hypothetical protein
MNLAAPNAARIHVCDFRSGCSLLLEISRLDKEISGCKLAPAATSTKTGCLDAPERLHRLIAKLLVDTLA